MLNENIKAIRKAKGLSQQELAVIVAEIARCRKQRDVYKRQVKACRLPHEGQPAGFS